MRSEFAGKRIVVIGAGESGLAAAKLLRKAGARVGLSTEGLLGGAKAGLKAAGIDWEEGGNTDGFLEGADAVVPSPGVNPRKPVLRRAAAMKLAILSEPEVAARFVRGKWAAVTGTNGKTTTCSLLAEMLLQTGPCDLCGNIGKAFSRSVLQHRAAVRRVVEMSSFQLHFSEKLRPDVAVILNLQPNHLDWHSTLSEYYGAKLRLLKNLTGAQTAVLNADDARLVRMARSSRASKLWFSLGRIPNGIYREGGAIMQAKNGAARKLLDLSKCRLVGDHNIQNVMAAACAALRMGVPAVRIQKAIDRFKPLHHRIEPVGVVDGIRFVNDSKSTTADSTRAAVMSFGKGIVLVAGGRAKEKDFRPMRRVLRGRVSCLVLYGEARALIGSHLNGAVRKVAVKDFSAAVERAYAVARKGETVLLSPMCASFDQFRSYQERGDTFKRIVRGIKESV